MSEIFISILLFIVGIITGLIVMFVIINIRNSKKQEIAKKIQSGYYPAKLWEH